MLRNKPTFTYNGLTVVLSNPSRFDNANLLSATGGRLFIERCLAPEYNRFQCDIRVKEDKSPLLKGTRCILLLGEPAAKDWLGEQMKDNTLNEVRGSVFYYDGVPVICSYFPQDAADIKNYEAELNKNAVASIDDDDDDDEYSDEKSRHNKTKRKNFAFWLIKDVEKCKYILRNNGIPARLFEPNYVLYPSLNLVMELLTKTKNKFFYLDLETDYDTQLQCFSFNFGVDSPIYCVPFLDHTYKLYYESSAKLLQALAVCMRDNTCVAHNGSGFDFIVLPWRYGIPLGRSLYDTMIASHRCFPEVEKSLGHCTSLWTWESFHKDEGDSGYFTPEQVTRKLRYCGKDVYTMVLIHDAISKHAKRIPGLQASIDQAMASLRPYIITSLQGIRYEQSLVDESFNENDRLMMQYIRMAKLLIGKVHYEIIQGKSKKPLLNSNAQCVKYFHELLGYPVVARGKEKKDGTRGPSLAKKAMYKLKLKHDNPVIDLCLAYRELAKESGSLKFTPLKNDEGLYTTGTTNTDGT